MHSQADLKRVANQTLEYVTVESPPTQSTSAMERLRTIRQNIQNRSASVFSSGSRQRGSAGSHHTEHQESAGEQEQTHENENQAGSMDGHPVVGPGLFTTMVSLGLDSPTLRSEGIVAARPSVDLARAEGEAGLAQSGSTNTSWPPKLSTRTASGLPRMQDRLFLVAILRQSLYPISISVCGCIQVIVDLTLVNSTDYSNSLNHAANVATSVQGFLFFLVFMFDPAVVQTRRHWKKYMVWKYYIEFFYSLAMPHEGRDFEERFIEKCQVLNRIGKEAKFDQLTKAPPYSWSLQYDDLAMPLDFQTSYPLSNVGSIPTTAAPARSQMTPSCSSNRNSVIRFAPAVIPRVTPENEGTQVESSSSTRTRSTMDLQREDFRRTDYTYSFPNLSPEWRPRNPDEEYDRIHPMARFSVDGKDAHGHEEHEQGQKVKENRRLSASSDLAPAVHESSTSNEALSLFQALSLPLQPGRAYSSDSSHGHYRRSLRQNHVRDSLDSDLAGGSDLELETGPKRPPHSRSNLSDQQPGDILLFPKLTKITTIGGGDGSSRQYRPMGARPSKASSGGRTTLGVLRNSALGEAVQSLTNRLRYARSNEMDPVQEKYRRQFRFPRLAYLMHMVIRQLYIPREVRLEPIANPFNKAQNRNQRSMSTLFERAGTGAGAGAGTGTETETETGTGTGTEAGTGTETGTGTDNREQDLMTTADSPDGAAE
ncbi:hypothetical protein BGZ54_000885 [Gamsiella multidivaricata]|nr:hypothetical protein BGZ54_000885 [Gamsiella multidivaricata]